MKRLGTLATHGRVPHLKPTWVDPQSGGIPPAPVLIGTGTGRSVGKRKDVEHRSVAPQGLTGCPTQHPTPKFRSAQRLQILTLRSQKTLQNTRAAPQHIIGTHGRDLPVLPHVQLLHIF